MGSSNPVKKNVNKGIGAAKDTYGSAVDDPVSAGLMAGSYLTGASAVAAGVQAASSGGARSAMPGNPSDFVHNVATSANIPSTSVGTLNTAKRTREDMRDQAAGMADKEMAAAAAAEARAVDASVKDLDPIALERRRRAALAANNGRAGTILTAGTSLGAADVGRKVLLGL